MMGVHGAWFLIFMGFSHFPNQFLWVSHGLRDTLEITLTKGGFSSNERL